MSGTSRLRPRTLLVVALALSAVAVFSAVLWQRFETDAAGPGSGMSLVVSDTTIEVGQKITVSVIMDDAPTVANNGPCSDTGRSRRGCSQRPMRPRRLADAGESPIRLHGGERTVRSDEFQCARLRDGAACGDICAAAGGARSAALRCSTTILAARQVPTTWSAWSHQASKPHRLNRSTARTTRSS